MTKRLLETKWRDPGEEPKLHLFGQLKRITRQWLDDHLVCKGGTYPAQLMYQELADMACERITAGIVSNRQLDGVSGGVSGSVAVGTMHLAKGLEFRAVAVAACDDEVIPLQARIERVGDDADLEEVYASERHLVYVACTRARDRLLVTGVRPGSEFLDDLRSGK